MEGKILAVCDTEERYLQHMLTYLERKELLPFTVCAFTSAAALKKFGNKKEIELLIIAENVYQEELACMTVGHMVILNESGSEVGSNIKNINKYQSCETIFRELMESYTGDVSEALKRLPAGKRMKIIGNYSPVRRCLQTTFALSMGQLLAKKHRVLYLNFESYSGFSFLMNREFAADLTDVLYFFNCEKEKLAYCFSGMVQSVNGLDFIPPVLSYEDLNRITAGQWSSLFEEIERISDYEYLILDLSEQMQGLFAILRQCRKVYTIIREDSLAAAKVRQYEEMLRMTDYRDVAAKTRKWMLPVFHRLPDGLGQLTHGELASYVKRIIEEDLDGWTE